MAQYQEKREGESIKRNVIEEGVPYLPVYEAMIHVAREADIPWRSVSIPGVFYSSRPRGQEGRFEAVITRQDLRKLVNRIRYDLVTA